MIPAKLSGKIVTVQKTTSFFKQGLHIFSFHEEVVESLSKKSMLSGKVFTYQKLICSPCSPRWPVHLYAVPDSSDLARPSNLRVRAPQAPTCPMINHKSFGRLGQPQHQRVKIGPHQVLYLDEGHG
jgi:hypothetical protein